MAPEISPPVSYTYMFGLVRITETDMARVTAYILECGFRASTELYILRITAPPRTAGFFLRNPV